MVKLLALTVARMSSRHSIAVVGCGMFGAMIALRLAQQGESVTVFDRQSDPLMGASYNNQNRLHLGFHYPRDDATARQCIQGFEKFRDEFPESINGQFDNAYFIASEGSFTSAKEYLAFCKRMDLNFEQIELAEFRPQVSSVDIGVRCDEVVYDCSVLRGSVLQKLRSIGASLQFESDVTSIAHAGDRYQLEVDGGSVGEFDAVINCTYADINRLSSLLTGAAPVRQFEYTLVPIIEWDQPTVGITIMDGPFMTVLPFGHTGKFLLYHVEHTVVERAISPQMPDHWRQSSTLPTTTIDCEGVFERMRAASQRFVPDLAGATLVGFLQGPRVVLANKDDTDARPSIIEQPEKGYFSVFTGKIDHCMWVADEIAKRVGQLFV